MCKYIIVYTMDRGEPTSIGSVLKAFCIEGGSSDISRLAGCADTKGGLFRSVLQTQKSRQSKNREVAITAFKS
jgi:hypothetical protein